MRGYDSFTLGNATQQSLEEIWNGPRYQDFRRPPLPGAAEGLCELRPQMEPLAHGKGAWVSVVIPALNEEEPIGDVVRAIPRAVVDEVLVVDNGSTDATAERARAAGARLVSEPRRGYGRLASRHRRCRRRLRDHRLPGRRRRAIARSFCLADRAHSRRQTGLRHRLADPGPARAQQHESAAAHRRLACRACFRCSSTACATAICAPSAPSAATRCSSSAWPETYGWNLEMQMRAARAGRRSQELPVDHRNRRGGRSKVSGNLSGSLKAVGRIVWTFQRLARDLR
jgi:hypothetical protein